MRAPLLAFALLSAAACTQGNVQLPPFFDGGRPAGDGSLTMDATGDGEGLGTDAAQESGSEAGVGDARSEAASDGGYGEAALSDASGGAG